MLWMKGLGLTTRMCLPIAFIFRLLQRCRDQRCNWKLTKNSALQNRNFSFMNILMSLGSSSLGSSETSVRTTSIIFLPYIAIFININIYKGKGVVSLEVGSGSQDGHFLCSRSSAYCKMFWLPQNIASWWQKVCEKDHQVSGCRPYFWYYTLDTQWAQHKTSFSIRTQSHSWSKLWSLNLCDSPKETFQTIAKRQREFILLLWLFSCAKLHK